MAKQEKLDDNVEQVRGGGMFPFDYYRCKTHGVMWQIGSHITKCPACALNMEEKVKT